MDAITQSTQGITMQDMKRTPVWKKRQHKPMGLMKGFYIAVIYAAFCGLVIGLLLNAIVRGNFLPF